LVKEKRTLSTVFMQSANSPEKTNSREPENGRMNVLCCIGFT